MPVTSRNHIVRGGWRRGLGVLVLALSALAGGGCVERSLVITSEPSGARVVVNSRWEGTTPITIPFRDYGVFQIEMEYPDYYPLRVAEPLKAPAYDVAGVDFFSNVLYPGKISDIRELHYRLEKRGDAVDELEDVQARAVAMRAERDRRIADRAAKDLEKRPQMPNLPMDERDPAGSADYRLRVAQREEEARNVRRNATASPGPSTYEQAQYAPPVPTALPMDIEGLAEPVGVGIRYGTVPEATVSEPILVAQAPAARRATLDELAAYPDGYIPPTPLDIPIIEAVPAVLSAAPLRYGEVPEAAPAPAVAVAPAPSAPVMPEEPAPATVAAPPSVPSSAPSTWNMADFLPGYTPPVPGDLPTDLAAVPVPGLDGATRRYGPVPDAPAAPAVQAPIIEAAEPAPAVVAVAPAPAPPQPTYVAPPAPRPIAPIVNLSATPGGAATTHDMGPPSPEALSGDWIETIVLK